MGLFSPQISTKSMVPLCRQLATSYEAGIPIIRSLDLVSEHTRDKKSKEVFQQMGEAVRQGATLGDAAKTQQKYLPWFFIALVSSGEHGGRLDVMLKDLAQYYEDRLRMQRHIKGMLAYPVIQMVAAWFIGTFAIMIVNRLNYESANPFDFASLIAAYIAIQASALGTFAVVLIAAVILSRLGIFQWISGWFLYYVWPFRNVARKFALARFFRSMSLLIGSGMNIKSCIQNSAMVVMNPYVERDLMKALPLVADGATLTQAFGVSKSLTPVSREMLHIGEQTGNLEASLKKVSEYHLEEASHAVNVVTRMSGVLILLAVAGVIGYVIITFYVRLYGGMLDAIN